MYASSDNITKKMDALLGHTGFVGSHLRENLNPDTTMNFNSKNLKAATDHEFRNVYCACVPAVKWWANKNPSEDFSQTQEILEVLVAIKFTGRFIYISTIDVHDHSKKNQVEQCQYPSKEPYGRHRLQLEDHLRHAMGQRLVVVRLPALFGLGLKKNMLFDLLEGHMLDQLNINTAFQWYSLSWLWEDLEYISKNLTGVNVVNLYPPPIESRELVARFFPSLTEKLHHGHRSEYNQGSIHVADRRSKADILEKMGEFVKMYAYVKGQNHMVVSNIAWEPRHDEHALFLMKRFGVRNIELLPTKHSTWENVFEDPTVLTKPFEGSGISVYSLQSLLYGVPGNFLSEPDAIKNHLDNVLKAAQSVGCVVAVLGSPKTRVHGMTETVLTTALDAVQSTTRNVKLCLEPNAKEYGCHVGTDMASVLRMTRLSSFSMNMDTGNALMSGDRMPEFPSPRIAHVQVSAPHLEPMLDATYADLDDLGMTKFILQTVRNKKAVRISLEVNLGISRINILGDQIRKFAAYCSRSFGEADIF